MLPQKSYHVIRVDGNNFRSYTKGLIAPYDEAFAEDMNAVTRELCKEVTGAIAAYTQSDEISIIFSDLQKENSQAYLGGKVNKIVSLTAALTTAAFNERRPGKRALFDSRVFSFESVEEVSDYLLWRQNDAKRNSVSMAGHHVFGHSLMTNKKVPEVKEMLNEKNISWDDYPDGFRLGRLSLKASEPDSKTFTHSKTKEVKTVNFDRTFWETKEAFDFNVNQNALTELLKIS